MEMRWVRLLLFLVLCASAAALCAEDGPDLTRGHKLKGADDGVDDTDPVLVKKTSPEKNKDAPPKPAVPANPPKPVAAPAAPKVVRCPRCFGTGYLPLPGRKAYARLLSEPAPQAAESVPWIPCPDCKKGQELKELTAAEAARLKSAAENANQRVAKSGLQLTAAETRHLTYYAPYPAQQMHTIIQALEALAEHLQAKTKLTLLTPTRPDSFELFAVRDQPGYEKALANILNDKSELTRKCAGAITPRVCIAKTVPNLPPEDQAVNSLAKMMILNATAQKAPPWLFEGFSAYGENAVLHRNLCYSINYEFSTVTFAPNWKLELAKLAKRGELKSWEQVFQISLISAKPPEYVCCFGVVSYLLEGDPRKFNQFVLNIHDGMTSQAAIESAYGRPVKDLEAGWAAWAMTQH